MPTRKGRDFSRYKKKARPARFERKATSPAEAKAAIEHFGSVREAAKQLGISKSTLHDYATGKTQPKRKTLARIDTGISGLPLKQRKAIEKRTVELLTDQSEFNKYLETLRATQGSSAVLKAIRARERQ